MSSHHRSDSLLPIAVAILAVVVLLPLLSVLFAMSMMGMMGWWGGAGTGPSPLWSVGTTLLVLVVLLGVGYAIYRGLAGSRTLERDRALEEVRLAYARGELSDEEFERRRQRLRRDRE